MTGATFRSKNELDAIEDLIPLASKTAGRRVKELGKESEVREGAGIVPVNWDFWTEFFHEEMLRLRIEAGLQ